MSNSPLTTIGRYQVLKRIGNGGMARVYKAYDARLNRCVALKFMRSELTVDSRFRARFEREAKITARLNHKNIVRLLDFGEHNERYYLVMEYIEGQTLKAHLKSLGQMGKMIALKQALSIIEQIASALDYAHKLGVIHRDVKPENIMLLEDGRAMLNDFGLAKIVDSDGELTITGVILGTPAYMPPEQIGGGDGNTLPASDIYSLGVIVYEMATGQRPFIADTPFGVLRKHLNAPIPQPSKHNPAIPAPLEQAILRALKKDPQDRYPSAGAFVRDLKRAV